MLRPEWALGVYLLALFAVSASIRVGGDRNWLATVMLFGPKWIYAVPMPILLLWTVFARRGRVAWGMLAVAAAMLLFPIGRFCIPSNPLARSERQELRILTFNAGGGDCDLTELQKLIASASPDVVCIQEGSEAISRAFGREWHTNQVGQLIIASRAPATQREVVNRDVAGRWPRAVCVVDQISLDLGPVYVATLHLYSPRNGLSDITSSRTILAPSRRGTLEMENKIRWDEHRQVSEALARLDGPVIVAGDFNSPAHSNIFRTKWSSYDNSFSHAGFGFGHTVCVEQGELEFSARIDHVLCSRHWIPVRCWVGPDVGSDHRPLIADLRWRTSD